MRALALVAFALALNGCSKPAGGPASAPVPNTPLNAAATQGPPKSALPAAGPMLAYRYKFGVESPAKRIADLVASSSAACSSAGPATCQVTGSNVEHTRDDQVSGSVTMKASPGWVTTLREKLTADVKAAGGRLVSSNVTSEDLSVQIVDVGARVKAQASLRDRLQDALKTRPGKISDFVDVSTALANAQGELDATQSELALLQQRLATSDITIEYSSSASFAAGGAWEPLSSALHGFLGVVATSLALLVYVVAFVLPIAAVAALIMLVTPRLRRRPPRDKRKPSDLA